VKSLFEHELDIPQDTIYFIEGLLSTMSFIDEWVLSGGVFVLLHDYAYCTLFCELNSVHVRGRARVRASVRTVFFCKSIKCLTTQTCTVPDNIDMYSWLQFERKRSFTSNTILSIPQFDSYTLICQLFASFIIARAPNILEVSVAWSNIVRKSAGVCI